MKQQITIVALLSLLLIFVACTGENTSTLPTGGYIGGSEGLLVTYVVDSPPAEILDAGQESFSIILQLENKGEYTIKENEVLATLTGINLGAYGVESGTASNYVSIDQIRPLPDGIIAGGVNTDIEFQASYKDDLPVDQAETITTNICYAYQTKATATMCLRKDVLARGEASDSCNVTAPLTSSNSGAPVQVTAMSQGIGGQNKLRYDINIQNVGAGVVYGPNALSAGKCQELGTNLKDTKGEIYVEILFPEHTKAPVSCAKFNGANAGTIKLLSGSQPTRLSCTIDTSQLQESTFTANPTVKLNYVYMQTVNTPILIKNIL